MNLHPERSLLEAAPGYTSRSAALAVAELDTLTDYLFMDLSGIGRDELAWQAAPGQNTIGMLLAHLAIVEVYWLQIGVLGVTHDVAPVLGIGMDDDGMPIAPGAPPPANLEGRDLDWYRGLMDKARAHTTEHLRALEEPMMDALRVRVRRDGSRHEFNVRWVLFHVLEHLAGHYGQILLVRHLHRDRAGMPAARG